MPNKAKTLSEIKNPTPKPDNRPSAYKRGYDTQWKKLRLYHLTIQPLCVRCRKEGYIVSAKIVDHIEPHKGNRKLRLDPGNLQSLCKRHHDIKTATEDGGFGRHLT
jgi:5-methylcytosine-specific restriction protein A